MFFLILFSFFSTAARHRIGDKLLSFAWIAL